MVLLSCYFDSGENCITKYPVVGGSANVQVADPEETGTDLLADRAPVDNFAGQRPEVSIRLPYHKGRYDAPLT